MKLTRPLFYLFFVIAIFFNVNIKAQVSVDDDSDLELPSVVTAAEQKIDSLAATVKKLARFIDKLDSATIFNMPMGIMGKGQNPSYSILIDTVMLKPDRAYFNASMFFICPNDGSKLAFRAENVPLTRGGGLVDPIKLQLVSQKNIKLGNGIYLTILPGSEVEWDCHGFKSMKLDARLTLSRKTFIPVDPDGKDLAKGRVTAFFETTIYDWNDLTFSISFDPFRLKKLPDIFFTCKDIAVDFSDFANPPNLVFPKNYQSLYPEGNINLWRGLFIGKAEIKLGKKFQKKNSKAQTSFTASNLLIDENGFTGELAATNLIGLNEGNMSGWAFSLENIDVKFQQSELTSASLKGRIHIPAFKDSTNFGYSAFIDNDGNYNFTVSSGRNLPFKLFGNSKLTLYPTSFIEIKSDSDVFVPTANLSGYLDVTCGTSEEEADSAKNKLQLAGIKFEEMRISTQEPMFSVKRFSIDSDLPGKFSKFPLTINNIGVRNIGTRFYLDFTVAINLTNSSDEGFSGSTALTLNAERNGNSYKYKGITVNEIRIDIVKPSAFEIHGQIAFARDDSIYGNGFRGALRAKFGDKFELGAVALFGTVNGTRYFFVDAMFGMTPGIPAGPITLTGFSGGLYQHMRQVTGVNNPNSFGASLSGLVYAPDPTIGIGVMAGVKFDVCADNIINAEAKFEIVFNSSGGLNRIGFEGMAKCITPSIPVDLGKMGALASKLTGGKKLGFIPEGAISLSLSMLMDFENHVFHAEFATYVNIGPVLKGVGENGKAGWGVIHIAQKEWYIYIGTPTDPIGMQLLGFIKVGGYFMMGYNIPTSLPLNPKVAQILNIQPEPDRDENCIAKGKGIAFGANMEINTGDLTFLIFYASFQFGAGFDIMLIDYGPHAYCEGSTPPLGINGWYAKGQVYAYLDGKIGIKIKVFGFKKKFDILSIAAAILFRAEAPNPLWMEGYAGGEFSVLGGMVKGKCKFKVTVGEKCKIVVPDGGAGLEDLKMISDITPEDKADGVDVFALPQVIFNVPVNKVIRISNDENIQQTFRTKLNKCELTTGTQVINCKTSWNADQNVLALEPDVILNPQTEYKLYAEVGFEENKNGTWAIYQENGKNVTEIKTATFKTGDLPDKIPASEVEFSYPLQRQYNFYPKEYNQAYIKFKRDIAPFIASDKRYSEIQWIASNGSKITSQLQYSGGERTLTVSPPENISLNTIYTMNIVSVPKDKGQTLDKNVTSKTENTKLDSLSDVNTTTKESTGETLTNAEEKTIYNINFKTSKFERFADKFTSGVKRVTFLEQVAYGEFYLGVNLGTAEGYDRFEVLGDNNTPPLIQMNGTLSNTPWFTQEVNPLVYANKQWFSNNCILWRDTSKCGLPPYKDIQIWQTYNYQILEDNEIQTGIIDFKDNEDGLVYTLPHYWTKDYYDIRDYLAYTYTSHPDDDPIINQILKNRQLRPVKPGLYPIKINYVLPGIHKITSSLDVTMQNEFKTSIYD